jgi:hypothetical protein
MLRIKLALGKTINLGNYQSARIDVGVEADVDDNNLPADIMDELRIFLKSELHKSINNKDWD